MAGRLMKPGALCWFQTGESFITPLYHSLKPANVMLRNAIGMVRNRDIVMFLETLPAELPLEFHKVIHRDQVGWAYGRLHELKSEEDYFDAIEGETLSGSQGGETLYQPGIKQHHSL